MFGNLHEYRKLFRAWIIRRVFYRDDGFRLYEKVDPGSGQIAFGRVGQNIRRKIIRIMGTLISFGVIGVAMLVIGLKLSRYAAMKRRIKTDAVVIDLTHKINKGLRETIDQINDGKLSDADISKLLTTYEKD